MDSACRRFVNESFATFQQVPRNVDVQLNDCQQRLILSECSVSFRRHLLRLTEEVSRTVELLDLRNGSREEISKLELEYDVLYSIEKSWFVCEIFTINSTPLLSLELVKWLKSICYPQALCSSLERFSCLDVPESVQTGSDGELGYWESVYQECLQGKTDTVCQLLRLHSEVAEAPTTARPGSISQAQCNKLFDAILSHPFTALVHAGGKASLLLQNSSQISAEFSSWQVRVRKLRQEGMPLLSRIPELDSVLRILLGEPSALESYSGLSIGGEWAWAKLAIAQLLYVHPPPLGAQDLSVVLEDCIRKGLASGCASTSLEKGYVGTLREVMAGNVGPSLRSLYQLWQPDHPSAVLALTPLLCTAHLSLLLVGALGREDILIPLADGPNETSFFEEVMLRAVQGLCAAKYSPEIVVQYLTLCPMRGREFSRALLPTLTAGTDSSVRLTAALLRDSMGWELEASALLRARGMWWLARSTAPALTASSSCPREQLLCSSTIAKAATFFCEAGDAQRVVSLLEGSLCRCMLATMANKRAFRGLSLLPTARGPFEQQLLEALGSVERTEQDHILELEAALLEAEELLSAVEVDRANSGDMAEFTIPLAYQCLQVYTNAVQTRFLREASTRDFMEVALQLAGLLKCDQNCEKDGFQLHFTAKLPSRHWLHILDLISWFVNCGTNRGQQETNINDECMDIEAAASRNRKASFTKSGAYALLESLQELCVSYGADLFITEAGSGQSNPGAALQTLKLNLLNVVCSSVIEENAHRAVTYIGDKSNAQLEKRWMPCTKVARNRPEHSTNKAVKFERQELDNALAYEHLTGSLMEL